MKNLLILSTLFLLLSACITSPHIQYTTETHKPSFSLDDHKAIALDLKIQDQVFSEQLTPHILEYFSDRGVSIVKDANLVFTLDCKSAQVTEKIYKVAYQPVASIAYEQAYDHMEKPGLTAMKQVPGQKCFGKVSKDSPIWQFVIALPQDYIDTMGTQQVHFIAQLFEYKGEGVVDLDNGNVY